MTTTLKLVALCALSMGLAACGGGGGSGGGAASGAGVPSAVAPAPVASPSPAVPVGECTVALYGDSILWLVQPSMPAALPGWTIDNRAHMGATATNDKALFDNDPRTAHYVVIEYAVNDAGQGLTGWQGVVSGMVDYVRAEGRVPVLTGIVSTPKVLPATIQSVEDIAASKGVADAEWKDVPVSSADGLHPDATMIPLLAAKLAAKLNEIAPGCAK